VHCVRREQDAQVPKMFEHASPHPWQRPRSRYSFRRSALRTTAHSDRSRTPFSTPSRFRYRAVQIPTGRPCVCFKRPRHDK
jgi:hypothetical protein